MKAVLWKAYWFSGMMIAMGLFGLAGTSGFIPGLERWACDLGVKSTSKVPRHKIAVIAIAEQSIANIGRWPWPREVQAKLIDRLAGAKAKVIGNTSLFFEPQKDPGLAYVEKMLDMYQKAYPPQPPGQDIAGVAPIGNQTPAARAAAAALAAATPPPEVAEIGKLLTEASTTLNSDARLSESVKKAGSVLVPMVFAQTGYAPPQGKPSNSLPEYVGKNTIGGTAGNGGQLLYGIHALVPMQQVSAVAAGIRHLHTFLADDGATRLAPL